MNLNSRKITAVFLVFGMLWIGVSDWLAVRVAQTQSQLVLFQSLKGWLFVVVSGALIFGLVHVRESQLRVTRDRLTIATQQLQVIHRIFRHNLRNELTVIRGYVESAQTALEREDIEHRLSHAVRAADRLEQLNDDLEILETVEVDQPSAEAVDLNPIIEAECDQLRSTYRSIVIDVEMPSAVTVYGDDMGLRLLVRRALEAVSVRYSTSSEHMHIDLEVTQTMSEVSVWFHSPNYWIPESEVTPVQAGEETPLQHALGVDLWVLKWLANLFDGDVDIDVSPESTTIEVSLSPVTNLEQLSNTARE